MKTCYKCNTFPKGAKDGDKRKVRCPKNVKCCKQPAKEIK